MCALPTAPLGQLGNMSMPYSIPTYEKGPGVLEKALAAFLVNAAGGVAQQGAQNVMSRDYAPEFGEESAKGFGRLLGPKVGERDASQRRGQTFTREENERQRSAARSLENVQQSGENTRLGIREKGEFQRTGMREAGDERRLGVQIGAQERLAKENREAQLVETALRQFLQQSDPTNVAQGRYYNANADSLGAKADFTNSLRGVIGRQGQPQATGASPAHEVNPNIAKFAQGGGTSAPTVVQSVPPQEDYYSSYQSLIDSGVSPDVALATVQRQSAVRNRVQGDVSANETLPSVEAILQALDSSGQVPTATTPIEVPQPETRIGDYFDPTTPAFRSAADSSLNPLREIIRLLSGQSKEQYDARRARQQR